MATTTNYGWTTPDDTALVKDGASAIRTLGSSVDTTTKALNPSTTLGDIEYRSSTANTNTRLGIGSTGQVLTVTGGVPTWATAGGGGFTSLATGTLSGASVTISSISGSYTNLMLFVQNQFTSSNGDLTLRLNGSTASEYNYAFARSSGNTVSVGELQPSIVINQSSGTADTNSSATVTIFNYANATAYKNIAFTTASSSSVGTARVTNGGANWSGSTNAITSIEMLPSSGSWGGGTYTLYGVK
jgi:hypothetical protein